MNTPLLSIIIPTRNRYKTLIPVIESIVSHIENSDIEIIIQDNSDDNSDFLSYLNNKNFQIINYFYEQTKLSMVENSENAISNSNGKYLIFIGDDDTVNPIILDVVKKMDKENIKSLIYPIANYFYSDVKFNKQYGFNRPSALSFNKNITSCIETLSSNEELNRVQKIGGIFILDLPRLYHGIVRKDLVESIRFVYGKYIPGPCPDMTLSVALATIINKYHRINLPLSVAGNSFASEGGKGPTNAHIVKLEDKSWLNSADIQDWDNNIPKIFSRQTIWCQSLFHVLSINDKPRINYKALYDDMIFSCPKKALDYVVYLYNKIDLPFFERILSLTKAFLKRYVRNVLFLAPTSFIEFSIKLRGDYKKKNIHLQVNSIDECMSILQKESMNILQNNL